MLPFANHRCTSLTLLSQVKWLGPLTTLWRGHKCQEWQPQSINRTDNSYLYMIMSAMGIRISRQVGGTHPHFLEINPWNQASGSINQIRAFVIKVVPNKFWNSKILLFSFLLDRDKRPIYYILSWMMAFSIWFDIQCCGIRITCLWKEIHSNYHPRMRIGNNFSWVCPSVCLCFCLCVCLFRL